MPSFQKFNSVVAIVCENGENSRVTRVCISVNIEASFLMIISPVVLIELREKKYIQISCIDVNYVCVIMLLCSRYRIKVEFDKECSYDLSIMKLDDKSSLKTMAMANAHDTSSE